MPVHCRAFIGKQLRAPVLLLGVQDRPNSVAAGPRLVVDEAAGAVLMRRCLVCAGQASVKHPWGAARCGEVGVTGMSWPRQRNAARHPGESLLAGGSFPLDHHACRPGPRAAGSPQPSPAPPAPSPRHGDCPPSPPGTGDHRRDRRALPGRPTDGAEAARRSPNPPRGLTDEPGPQELPGPAQHGAQTSLRRPAIEAHVEGAGEHGHRP